jgi:hypothetical protein
MPRVPALRLVATILVIPAAIGLAGCGAKSASSSTNSSQSASSGSCAGGYVSGKIAGQAKCLQNGQQCQQVNSSDYKKYGFTCAKTNGRYELKKS